MQSSRNIHAHAEAKQNVKFKNYLISDTFSLQYTSHVYLKYWLADTSVFVWNTTILDLFASTTANTSPLPISFLFHKNHFHLTDPCYNGIQKAFFMVVA